MRKPDGGPAFPQVPNGHPDNQKPGMTMRDYFAAAALQACIPTCNNDPLPAHTTRPEYYAQLSYECADAMLAERAK